MHTHTTFGHGKGTVVDNVTAAITWGLKAVVEAVLRDEIDARHREMTADYCRMAAKEGVKFVISSDAHRPADVGALFDWLRQKRSRTAWADWAEQPPLDRERDRDHADEPRGARRPSDWTDWSSQGKIH